MKKTILSSDAVDDFIKRSQKLTANSQGKWGIMNPTEMLVHCNMANQGILKAPKSNQSATLRQLINKFVFFNVRSEFPKLAKGPKRYSTAGNASETTFEEQKSKFVYILGKYRNLEIELEGFHPIFGPLTHQQWGIFIWMHVDHHLRQFGM